jgi:undecaprenyl-diphosphatase
MPMSPWEAVVLGFVQGATEFLPISSTAHLRIVPALLGKPDPGAAFTAVIQWGTFFAAVWYFRRDLGMILAGWLGLRTAQPLHGPDSRLGWMILLGTLPIVVFGLLLEKKIDHELRGLEVIAWALIGLGVLLALADWRSQRAPPEGLTDDLTHLTWAQGLLIGLAQALALVPGASRSGVTITAALFVGLSRPAAARFSFLLSLPAIFGAGLYKLLRDRHDLFTLGAGNVLIATVVAAVVGYASIAWLLSLLRKHSLLGLILYRIALGVTLLALCWSGALK